MVIDTQSDPTETTVNEIGASNPAFTNPAVAICCKAWKRVYRAVMMETEIEFRAARAAGEAYRAAMPPLSSRDNCFDFIACVAHGMAIGAIHEKNGTKLLYAAQVALSASNAQRNPPKPPDSRANTTPSEAQRVKKLEDRPSRKK